MPPTPTPTRPSLEMSRPPAADPLPLPWPLLRSFVAVVEAGNLTQAAARLGCTQPTVGRHIRALEKQLGETLFDRLPTGLRPTHRATALFERALAVAQAVTGLSASLHNTGLDGSPQAQAVEGTVRITSTECLSMVLLPELLAPLLQHHPKLQLELVCSDEVHNLLRREADVAVRLARPDQLDVVATQVGELPLGLYAHRSYLARHPLKQVPQDWTGHTLISPEDTHFLPTEAARMGFTLPPACLRFRSSSMMSQWAALLAGVGVGFCHDWMAQRHPDLVRLLPADTLPALPVWVAAHDDLHRSRRIRLVFDHLVQALRAQFSPPEAPGRGNTSA